MRRRQLLTAIAAAVAGTRTGLAQWWPQQQTLSWGPLPARAGTTDVDQVRLVTDHLRTLDAKVGGGATVDPARAALAHAARLLDRVADDRTRTDLDLALADMANVTGWACHDSGQQDDATGYLMWGLDRALASGTAQGTGLAANLMFGLARVALYRQDPRTALGLVEHGHTLATAVDDRGATAQLHATAAWAHAILDNPHAMTDSLTRAEDAMSSASAGEPWKQIFFSAGDFAGHQALMHCELANHTADASVARASAATALDKTRTSLSAHAPDRPSRSRTFDAIVAAQSALRLGDLDTGITMTRRALTGARETTSRRANDRLREVINAAAPHTHNSTLTQLHHELVSATSGV
ncbi:hypothetical protein OG225_41470 (plasmid) [Nocardia sp. NBC_01377]|uniref:hypothetical protein n=1 Tax=Nocardia sp. NBC_01377 TaxID=2903595 RepID=UPI00325489DA